MGGPKTRLWGSGGHYMRLNSGVFFKSRIEYGGITEYGGNGSNCMTKINLFTSPII